MSLKPLAIIPARGGSKRIPRKNIRPFAGKPLLAYSVDAAFASGCFSRVIVSTEDAEIAEVARALGAEVPFLRSAESANDHATLADVLIEVINDLTTAGQVVPDVLCCLMATAPFITAQRLQEGWALLQQTGADSVVPLMPFGFPIMRAVQVDEQRRFSMIWPEHYNTRSQDLPQAWHDAGQFYWSRVGILKATRRLYHEHSVALPLKPWEAQDIDTEEDWQLAELKYQLLTRQTEGLQ
jgi:pseudaminic acid cytidylyltransferase